MTNKVKQSDNNVWYTRTLLLFYASGHVNRMSVEIKAEALITHILQYIPFADKNV